MEEKVLIKSEPYNIKKLVITLIIIGLLISLFVVFLCYKTSCMNYNTNTWVQNIYTDEFACFQDEFIEFWWYICLIPVAIPAVIGGLIYLWLRSFELTVTDKRIYGKVAWGKRVDLPVDSVSATATLGSKGVAISTSSGRIRFRAIKNANEIYEVINNLLIERQQKRNNATIITPVTNTTDEADQIKKYKDLLDNGVITQEEFDAKKKQLLGL